MAARFRRKRITSLAAESVEAVESVESARLNAHVFILITCCTHTQTHTHKCSTSCSNEWSLLSSLCLALPCLVSFCLLCCASSCSLRIRHVFYVKAASVTLSLGRDTLQLGERGHVRGVASFEKLSHICSRLPWLSYDTLCLPP